MATIPVEALSSDNTDSGVADSSGGPSLDDLYKQVHVRLGGVGVEVELEDEDYETAFDGARREYLRCSRNAVAEGWIFVQLHANQKRYAVPPDIDNVKMMKRTRAGLIVGNQFEAFSAAFIQGAFGYAGERAPGVQYDLATYDAVAQYQETVGMLFGERIRYQFDRGRREVELWITPRDLEVVGWDVSRIKTVRELLVDHMAYRWLRSYTEAEARGILGEKYTKYQSLPGPGGSTTLKGERLITQSEKMKTDLVAELRNYADGGYPAFPRFG